jgi:3-hydroxyisobutyrate dehydrogenase-like beta-hydroxyacid dehydrogenase
MSRRTQKNVGVIGLGIIGRRVADCLRRRGFHVFVWNRTPRPYPNFVGSPAEIAELCDFVQIFVSDDTAVLQMVQHMKPALKAHHVVMVHSTIAPDTMREAAEIVQRRGARLLDAPFTGSKGAAEKAEIVYYVAGDDAAYRRARPVLEASSKEIIEIGEIGQATTIKLATNMITAATVQVAAEALALVDAAGVPLEKFDVAMRSNGSNSGTLTMKLPKMLSGDFETQFSVKHMLKDVQIVMREARGYGLSLGVTEVARAALIDEAEGGGADRDYSAVARKYFPEPPAPVVEEEPAAEPEVREPEAARAPEPQPGSEPEPAAEVERQPVAEVEREPVAEVEREPEPRREEPMESAREEAPKPSEPESPRIVVSDPDPEEQRADESEEDAQATRASNGAAPRDEAADSEEHEDATRDEDETGNVSTAEEPERAVSVAANHNEQPAEERRGFLSRIFGRSTDY